MLLLFLLRREIDDKGVKWLDVCYVVLETWANRGVILLIWKIQKRKQHTWYFGRGLLRKKDKKISKKWKKIIIKKRFALGVERITQDMYWLVLFVCKLNLVCFSFFLSLFVLSFVFSNLFYLFFLLILTFTFFIFLLTLFSLFFLFSSLFFSFISSFSLFSSPSSFFSFFNIRLKVKNDCGGKNKNTKIN